MCVSIWISTLSSLTLGLKSVLRDTIIFLNGRYFIGN